MKSPGAPTVRTESPPTTRVDRPARRQPTASARTAPPCSGTWGPRQRNGGGRSVCPTRPKDVTPRTRRRGRHCPSTARRDARPRRRPRVRRVERGMTHRGQAHARRRRVSSRPAGTLLGGRSLAGSGTCVGGHRAAPASGHPVRGRRSEPRRALSDSSTSLRCRIRMLSGLLVGRRDGVVFSVWRWSIRRCCWRGCRAAVVTVRSRRRPSSRRPVR